MMPREQRFDIQFLRGVAVLLVVVYHGFGRLIPHGFLGVDVFFVLSGYLITGIVLKGLDDDSFSFRAFYLRRARRLLPAAYSTFIGTTLLAYFVLTSTGWSMYLLQLFGSVTFSANIVLSQMAGYFAPAAETKPLLHIWSLSLEEQFYFVMPFLLWVVGIRLRLPIIVVGALLSIGLCLFMVSRPDLQSLAFYLLPTRAWELLAGSICAWLALRRPVPVHPWIQWLGLGIITIVCIVGFDPLHPRLDALAVVIATSVIILGQDNWLPRTLLSKPVATVGDWSYSLYLVHWPLFSFAYIAYMAEPPAMVLSALVVLALLLAWLQFRFVETPFRYAWNVRPKGAWIAFAAMTALVGIVAAPAAYTKLTAKPQQITDLRPNVGLGAACSQQAAVWRDIPQCRTSARPAIAIWGDSNAMHLVPGLADLPIIQLTRPACSPIVGVAPISADYSPAEAAACISFTRSAFQHIITDRHIKYVVISSPFAQTFVESGQRLVIDGKSGPWRDAGPATLARTVKLLQQAGKVPFIVSPIPRTDFDPGACYLRLGERKPVLGRQGCDFDRSTFTPSYSEVVQKLKAVSAATGARLFLPETVVCQGNLCRTRIGDTILYRDQGHLTRAGSKYVVKAMGLRDGLGSF